MDSLRLMKFWNWILNVVFNYATLLRPRSVVTMWPSLDYTEIMQERYFIAPAGLTFPPVRTTVCALLLRSSRRQSTSPPAPFYRESKFLKTGFAGIRTGDLGIDNSIVNPPGYTAHM